MNPLILVIEDDEKIAELIRLYLVKEEYRVLIAHDGKTGLKLALSTNPKLLILDRMLPNLEGLELLKKLRKENEVPVIVLSAKSDEFEKVLGLELGADDYVSKPFSPKELMARVKSVLRRAQVLKDSSDEQTVLTLKGLRLDPKKMQVFVDDEEVKLSAVEFKLLMILASNAGRVFTREQIMNLLYSSRQNLVFDRTIDVHIKNLRKKMKDPSKNPRFIASVFGVGYKFIDHAN